MRLAYIDESYTDAYYFIGALVVGDDSASALDRGLGEVAVAAKAAHLPAAQGPLELHGYPLFQGKGEWAPAQQKIRARIAVYEEAMRVIGQQNIQVFLHGLDRRSHRDRYGTAAWPAHEVDDPERHRLDLRRSKLHGTPGHRSSRLENILDTLHFAPSHHSRLIRAADLVTFLHRRHRTTTDPDPRQAAITERLWGHVRHDALQQVDARTPRTVAGPKACGRLLEEADCLISMT
jgi:hypothetical protein